MTMLAEVVHTAPREVTVPGDLADALEADPTALRSFEALSYGQQLLFVLSIQGAKQSETRRRRIARTVTILKEGRNR